MAGVSLPGLPNTMSQASGRMLSVQEMSTRYLLNKLLSLFWKLLIQMQNCHLGRTVNQTVLTFNTLTPTGLIRMNLRERMAVPGSEKDKQKYF